MKITLEHGEMYPVPFYDTDFRLVQQWEFVREVDDDLVHEYNESYERFKKACGALEAAYKASPRGVRPSE